MEATTQQDVDTDLPEAPPPPLEPAVMARPGCVNLSLYGIVEDRRPKERISFEVAVLAELFVEMLQRDFGYRIYKTLLSLPEKVVSPPEPEKEEAAKEDVVKEEETVKEEAVKVSKDEVQNEGTAAESDSTLVSTVLSPGLDQGPHIVKLSMIRAPHVCQAVLEPLHV